MRQWARTRARGSRAQGPAVILADQAQAFETIGLAWLVLVLRAWELPPWAITGFMDVTADRQVVAAIGRWLGPRRLLHRGMGMGGPASPLLWNAGFDPIIVALADALGVECPTFVDDLMAEVWGPQEALEAEVLLLFLGAAAGLRVETHHCQRIRAEGLSPADLTVLRTAPLRIVPDGTGHVLSGLPCDLLRALILAAAPNTAVFDLPDSQPCTCRVKTTVVPAEGLDHWRDCHRDTPLGADAVRASARYLGIQATSPGNHWGLWDRAALGQLERDTWDRHLRKAEERVRDLCHQGGSTGQRAHGWNTYVASLVPYPAQTAAFPAPRVSWADGLLRDVFQTWPWLPALVLPGLGPLFGVRGCPRCLWTAAVAAGSVAFARDGGWGPEPERRWQRGHWDALAQWAAVRQGPSGCPRPERALGRLAAGAASPDPGHRRLRAAAGQIYQGHWLRLHEAGFWDWARSRAAARTWLEGGAGEWRLLWGAHFTTAVHVLRVLFDGIRGPERGRPAAHRDGLPRRCFRCGSGHVARAWTTPSAAHPGLGVCRACLTADEWSCGHGAAVRTAFISDGTPPAPGSPDLVAALRAAPRSARPCHLCGLGEQSGEHLCCWCPVVAGAWDDLGLGRGLCATLAAPGEAAPAARVVLHQAAFLHAALSRQGEIVGPARAAGLLRRCIRSRAARHGAMDMDEDDLGTGPVVDLEDPGSNLAQACDAWTVRPPDCATCQAAATPPPQVSAATEVRRGAGGASNLETPSGGALSGAGLGPQVHSRVPCSVPLPAASGLSPPESGGLDPGGSVGPSIRLSGTSCAAARAGAIGRSFGPPALSDRVMRSQLRRTSTSWAALTIRRPSSSPLTAARGTSRGNRGPVLLGRGRSCGASRVPLASVPG